MQTIILIALALLGGFAAGVVAAGYRQGLRDLEAEASS